jgi:hypothetical protein
VAARSSWSPPPRGPGLYPERPRHPLEIEAKPRLLALAEPDDAELLSMRVDPVLVHAKASRHLPGIRKSEPQLRPQDFHHLLDDTLCDRLDVGLREPGGLLIRVAPGRQAASPVV